MLRINEWTIAAYDRLGAIRRRFGNRIENSAPIDNYVAADGRIVCIVAGADANFRRLCQAMERPDLLADPRYETAASRAENGEDINMEVALWVKGLDAAEVEKRCVDNGVPVAPVLDVEGIFA